MRTTAALLLLLAGVALAAPIIVSSKHIDVETLDGPVRGIIKDQVQRFYAVPFAAPPVDELRFKRPQPSTPWKKTFDATSELRSMERRCLQTFGPLVVGTEDCLNLNIFVPHNLQGLLPVMFFIHGGGFTVGDADEFHLYDGSHLAMTQSVIVVSINYRLGPLGFLSLPELMAEDEEKSTGNYGMMDQRFALQWVKKNIDRFGGDPSKITIFGESAGGFSICYHYASPASQNLFSAAIVESGSCDSTALFQPLSKATKFSQVWTAAAGCDRAKFASAADFLGCVRKLPGKILLKDHIKKDSVPADQLPLFYPALPWGPVVDGTASGMQMLPIDLLQQGASKVPLMIGTNKDEGSLFVPALSRFVSGVHFPLGEGGVKKILHHYFNDSTVDVLLSLYPRKNFSSWDHLTSVLIRDWLFVCETRTVARAVTRNGLAAFVYHFVFNYGAEYRVAGDFHSAELNFVFGNANPPLVGRWNEKHKEMASVMMRYWGNFAKFGNPNGNSPLPSPLVAWPRYDEQKDEFLVLDTPPSTDARLDSNRCDFWQNYRWPM